MPATPGQLIIKEMQKSTELGYTPIGLVDDDPRKQNLRVHGVRVLGHDGRAADDHRRLEPGRGDHRDPLGGRRDAAAHRQRVP